uniref:Uncharacterized protein n=1 Tax=viral metagenome TaxID=1070528 RepID=A0A6C0I440_9ZZZZ
MALLKIWAITHHGMRPINYVQKMVALAANEIETMQANVCVNANIMEKL